MRIHSACSRNLHIPSRRGVHKKLLLISLIFPKLPEDKIYGLPTRFMLIVGVVLPDGGGTISSTDNQ